MRPSAREAATLIAREGAVAMVTVAHSRGSVPREAPTRMLVGMTLVDGTIGGGNLEHQAIEQARKLLADPIGPRYIFQHYALGPLLDQCCGGAVTLLIERLDAGLLPHLMALVENPDAVVLTSFDTMGPVKRLIAANEVPAGLPEGWRIAFIDPDGTLADPDLAPKAPAFMLEAVSRPRARLYMFGAGHVGRAVARAIAPLNFAVTWVDARAEEFPAEIPAGLEMLVTETPLDVVAAAPAGSHFLVFTHSHPLDYELTAAILARRDAAYCGLIGSATKRARFENRMLKERRVTEADLVGLTCPIGLPGIRGKEPEVIAASTVAQLLALISR